MFIYDAESIEPMFAELDEWKSQLDYRGPLPRAWNGRLRRDLEAEAVAASTSMEGVPVTVEDVLRILVGDRPSEVTETDAGLVNGYRDAMGFVLRRADDPGFRWDPELLVALHDRVLAGRHSVGAGRFRLKEAFVVDHLTGKELFTPPGPDLVVDLIGELCSRMELGFDHPALAAAWVHVALAGVHPFADGNGRTARILSSLAMVRGGFKLPEFTSLEEWWGRHLPDYYAAFKCLGSSFDPKADVTPFLAAHLEAQLHQVRGLELRGSVERRIWAAIEEVASQAGLKPRVANSLWDAFFGRIVTPRYYRGAVDVSVATATNDLRAVVSAGFLWAQGAGRARRYIAGARLFPEVATALELAVDASGEMAREAILAEVTRRVSARQPGRFPDISAEMRKLDRHT